ncbi:NADH-quinone oxidoreductase subunit L [Parenemella sanctibonifatiensis]|uniref:NADH-quinone oxidoreductase subunit L n=1 Tax=Parenemella sanctibonifatiensis TaxID=2016505 RepID=A0A255ECA1_9ACTN|nr:NADH-quinone oxidoreductase subunit L [Parenemella sanctibonifatiensis]OYN89166.1 NADH-quinone oxidoreductase subunit L [Parenemella sanctibonifatiensis]
MQAAEPTGVFSLAWLIIALPLVVSGVLLLLGSYAKSFAHYLATAAVLGSFGLGVAMFVQLLAAAPEARQVNQTLWDWFSTGNWTIEVGLQVDVLSILFVLLITGVGSLIHIYSIGYMAHDERRERFFAFLNLFVAAMLLLVLADSYIVLFVGWEGVGLASYLLIGFWQHKPSAAAAAKKAFVINRVGDVGMSIAMMLMLAWFGSTAYADVNAGAANLGPTATLLGLLLLVGACAKSAQVPLQAWLLDAMEGPTPVSALIHAATMVTAGVYLVVRSDAIFSQSETATTVVVIIGTITLLAGAWIGCSKDDIKKVLAGSTMSQIGYMMVAAGIGPAGYAFAIFHLITHGFFKANMFLGAGSVMHAMNDDVDMRRFGALARVLPITFGTFACGYLAIIGFPFLSGYYSKDHIIEAAFEHNAVVGSLAILGAGVTAFYMTRLMFMTFFSAKRWREGVHPHESPASMTVPLIILAVLSVAAGFVMNSWIGHWLEPIGAEVHHEPAIFATSPVAFATLAVVAIGVVIGWLAYGRGDLPQKQPRTRNPFAVIGRNDLFGDAINHGAVVAPVMGLVRGVTAVDDGFFSGGLDTSAAATGGLSKAIGKLQNGYVRSYALTMVLGGLAVGLVLIIGRLA